MFQYQLAIWEYNEASWHESSLSEVSTSLNTFEPHINPFQFRIEISPWPDIKQYINLVCGYTSRKLTHGGDGLNAISSLLSVLSSSFNGNLIYGLPEMFLMKHFSGKATHRLL
jgi:hypothetical protein